MSSKKALMLRTCKGDMTSFGGFTWPTSGHVMAPDWDPSPLWGYGLHGLLWGKGNPNTLSWSPDAKWVVAEIDETLAVDLYGEIKVPWAKVVHVGDRRSATQYLAQHGANPAEIVGYRAINKDVYDATIVSACGEAVNCAYGTAFGGWGSIVVVGRGGRATAGHDSFVVAGDGGHATARDFGVAVAGDYGFAHTDNKGLAVVGDYGLAVIGPGGVASVGRNGKIAAFEWSIGEARFRYFTMDCPEPGVFYTFNGDGFAPVRDEENCYWEEPRLRRFVVHINPLRIRLLESSEEQPFPSAESDFWRQ